MNKLISYLLIILMATVLSACGGSDDDSDSGTDSSSGTESSDDGSGGASEDDGGDQPAEEGADDVVGGTAVERADFSPFNTTGAWRITTAADYIVTSDVTRNDTSVEVTRDVESTEVDILTTLVNEDGTVTGDYCNEYGSITLPEPRDEEEMDDSYLEEGEYNSPFCDTSDIQYVEVSDTLYRIDKYCDDVLTESTEYALLSDVPEFNFGTLSFTSDQFDDLDTDSGVCGTRDDFSYSKTAPQPNDLNISDREVEDYEIGFAAPYGENLIYFEIETTQPFQAITYTVVEDFSGEAVDEVEVEVTSATFGSTLFFPADVDAIDGSVTLSAVSANAVEGSFDLTTETGDRLQGSFSFNLE